MAQFVALFDTALGCVRNSGQPLASSAYTDYDFSVVSPQSNFTVGQSLIGITVDLFINGIQKRLGLSNDYTISIGSSSITTTFNVPSNAWVRVRLSSATFNDNHYDVGAGGISQFVITNGTVGSTNRIDAYVNGQLLREGASFDYLRNVSLNRIDFNYTVPQNAWVLIRVN